MEIKHTDAKNMEHKIKDVLRFIGEDPAREGLIKTPERMVRSWEKLFGGYKQKPEEILRVVFQDKDYNEMVILDNIEFYSTCEHHFLPFFGKIHIGYVPNKKVVGVSKLARLVEIYARRLQIQERLVLQIADDIKKYLEPKGCIVIAEAQHFCMTSRGVEKQNARMRTSAIKGVFEKQEARQEFLSIVYGK